MTSSRSDRTADRPGTTGLGLRERKKARTRAAVQEHALRLFREQGYAETTVDQIAAAAEISPSTFFRYFPTKEATVAYDRLDPILMDLLADQPAELSAIAAIRLTLNAVYGTLSEEDWERERARMLLINEVPELRAGMFEDFAGAITMMAEALGKRVGRPADDFEVRNLAGAVAGVVLAAYTSGTPTELPDFIAKIDRGFAHLEAGLPL